MKTINNGNKGTVTITADYNEVAILQLALKKLMTQTTEKELASEASRLLHDVSNPVSTSPTVHCSYCNAEIPDVNKAWHEISEFKPEGYIVCSLDCLKAYAKRFGGGYTC